MMSRLVAASVAIVLLAGCAAKRPVSAMGEPAGSATATEQSVQAVSATAVLEVDGLVCNACASTVASALQRVGGVQSAQCDLATKKATVAYDPKRTTPEQLVAAVNAVPNMHDASKTYTAKAQE
jgi:copper chaperone CopZ